MRCPDDETIKLSIDGSIKSHNEINLIVFVSSTGVKCHLSMMTGTFVHKNVPNTSLNSPIKKSPLYRLLTNLQSH